MSNDFAKLFNNTKYGQILVKLDSNEYSNNTEIRYYFVANNSVQSMYLEYKEEHAEITARKMFDNIDEASCIKLIDSVLEEFPIG